MNENAFSAAIAFAMMQEAFENLDQVILAMQGQGHYQQYQEQDDQDDMDDPDQAQDEEQAHEQYAVQKQTIQAEDLERMLAENMEDSGDPAVRGIFIEEKDSEALKLAGQAIINVMRTMRRDGVNCLMPVFVDTIVDFASAIWDELDPADCE